MDDDIIITRVIMEEGGAEIVDKASDSGGVTKFGITVPFFTDYLRVTTGNSRATATAEDIRALTEADARAVYRWFMAASRIGRIPNMDVRQFVFDAAVNIGPKQPIRWLQRALGLAGDGVIGPATLAAIPYKDGLKLCRLIGIEQVLFYGRLVTGNLTDADKDGVPDKLESLNGWLNRWADNTRRIA